MENNKILFVRTHDKNTSNQLLDEGFQLIDDKNGWTFLNKACKCNFDLEELKVAFAYKLNK